MTDSALQSFERHVVEDMTARGFRYVLTHAPTDQDAAVLVFAVEPVPRHGPWHAVVITVTGLELVQNADHLRDLARARCAKAAAAYLQEQAA